MQMQAVRRPGALPGRRSRGHAAWSAPSPGPAPSAARAAWPTCSRHRAGPAKATRSARCVAGSRALAAAPPRPTRHLPRLRLSERLLLRGPDAHRACCGASLRRRAPGARRQGHCLHRFHRWPWRDLLPPLQRPARGALGPQQAAGSAPCRPWTVGARRVRLRGALRRKWHFGNRTWWTAFLEWWVKGPQAPAASCARHACRVAPSAGWRPREGVTKPRRLCPGPLTSGTGSARIGSARGRRRNGGAGRKQGGGLLVKTPRRPGSRPSRNPGANARSRPDHWS